MIKNAPTKTKFDAFFKATNFKLPQGFLDFFKDSNGADIDTEKNFILLWPLTEMIELNKAYKVDEYAPDFFIFGSDGGDKAFAIESKTGDIDY